jgi:hypothetical protein
MVYLLLHLKLGQTKNKAVDSAHGLTEKRRDEIKKAVGVVCTHGLR